jgi:hypothetical protein
MPLIADTNHCPPSSSLTATYSPFSMLLIIQTVMKDIIIQLFRKLAEVFPSDAFDNERA